MLQRARLVRQIFCSRSCTIAVRSYGSRSKAGTFDKKTRKTMEEIKDLEYRLEASKKREETLSRLAELSERDAEAVYAELTAPPPPRLAKVGPDYLERLRVKFLDTRPLQLDDPKSVKALPAKTATEQDASATDNWQQDALQIIEKSPKTLVASDYEQLIYANALARRPREAERVLELMQENGVEPSLRAYNHVVDAYANAHDVDGALAAYKRIKQLGLQPDLYTYGILIKAFVQHSRLSEAFVIFEQLKKSDLIPDQIIFSTLIAGCIKNGEIDRAWDLFDAMRLSYHQPDEVAFTMMIQACAKRGEVERALNMFEDMTGNGLHPTDVTFNALISACAKRPDYYETAFDLFEQMHTVYNFEPDRITYNILLSACARKRELKRAREIVQTMHAHQQQQSDSMISPDEHTFITLFSCYANYNPPSTQKMTATVKDEAAATLVEHSLFLPILPVRRSQVVEEAKHVYNYIISNKLCDVSSELITAYLDVHITQKRSTECLLIYDHEFAKYNVEHLPKTFSHMLRYAYDTRDSTLAWKVWEDYQEFLESRSARFPDNPDDSIVERKRIQDERTACQRREEWTLAHQRTMLRSMANTLGRGNDVKNAIKLLQTYFPKSSREAATATMQRFKLSELKPLYDKCIQIEDQDSKEALKRLCIPDRRSRPADWRFRKQ